MFAANAAGLVPSEGDRMMGQLRAVDEGRTGLNGVRNTERTGDVLREHARRQPVDSRVRGLDHLFEAFVMLCLH